MVAVSSIPFMNDGDVPLLMDDRSLFLVEEGAGALFSGSYALPSPSVFVPFADRLRWRYFPQGSNGIGILWHVLLFWKEGRIDLHDDRR